MERGGEDSSFSEEKEAKRLLIVLSRTWRQTCVNEQKLFGSFFQKRTLTHTSSSEIAAWPT
jgi:hypothetical protein